MAFDHPERVEKVAVLDIVPTWEAYKRADMAFGLSYFHWFFMTQPFDLPERLIGADPEFYWRRHTSREPKGPGFFAAEALADYLQCFRIPATIHAICEDYRAGREAAGSGAGVRAVLLATRSSPSRAGRKRASPP